MKINRIILLTHEYPPTKGGAGIYCKEIAESAYKQNINIEIWAPMGSVSQSDIRFKNLPWKGSQSWLSSFLLIFHLRAFLIRANKIITFHVADPGVSRAFIRLGWLLPKNHRKIITLHGSELLKFTRNPLERFLFRKLLSKTSLIHVLSRFNADRCERFSKQVKSKIRLIPGAPSSVVLSHPSPKLKNRDTEGIQILCVGRIHRRKGQLELLQALLSLPANIQNSITIIFAGPVNQTSYMKKLKRMAVNFTGKITFAGEVSIEDLHLFYRESDIFSLTPIITKKSVEGFGFVYLEASYFGLPIMATKVGGVEDAVLDRETGLLSDPNNQEELKSNLTKLVENRSLRKKLGENGKLWAKQHSWENIAQKLYLEN